MARIIYQPPEKSEKYLINEDAQQLLAYLYLYNSSHPNELANELSYRNGKEIINAIDDDLGQDGAKFISLRYTNQLTLGKNNVPEISLAKDGRKFVKKHRFEIRAPFSVHKFVQEMKMREKEIEETLRKILVKIEDGNELEYTSEGIDGLMKRVEDHFDEIRNKRV